MNKQIGNREQNENYPYGVFSVGDRAHIVGYSDINPATVVKVERGGTKVTVRADSYELNENSKPEFVSGGFVAHCTNQNEIKYDITENPSGGTCTFTLRKWRGRYCWTHANCQPDGRQKIGSGWRAFYDYNF